MPSTLWEDIKRTVKEGVSVAAEKTEEYTKIGKVKVDILNIKRNIEKLHEDLGKQVYGLIASGKKQDIAADPKVGTLFKKLTDQQAALKKKEADIEKIKQEVTEKSKSRKDGKKQTKTSGAEAEKPEAKKDTAPSAETKSAKAGKPASKAAAKSKTTSAKKPKTGA